MMSRLWAVSITLVIIGVASVVAHAQEVSEREVKTEVRAAWDAYIEAFSGARTDVVANDVSAAPSFQLGAGGANVRMTAADTKAAFDATHRSETDTAESCVLNEGAALLTAHFTRCRTDDSVLTKGASAYLLGKFDDGWRIVAIIGNPVRKLVACE